MGCFGALFKTKSESEFAPVYPPAYRPAETEPSRTTQVEPSIPDDVAHFEPCGCGELGGAFARVLAADPELPAYSPQLGDEFKDDKVRKTIRDTIALYADRLRDMSLYISDHPEEGYAEHKACAKLTGFLAGEGFRVETPYKDLPTAFRASFSHGSGGRTFAFCSEYDALPSVGHACGHNLIAVSGVAALLGVRAAMRAHGIAGTAVLLGTPAEEGGVGKGVLIERGAFARGVVDACMMLHPTGLVAGAAGRGAVVPTLAVCGVNVDFEGRAAHAGMAPWDGVNALDAAHVAYAAVAAWRQQLRPAVRVHGIITHGGDRPNIVPAHTRMEFYVRAPAAADVTALAHRLTAIFDAAGAATGCKVRTETTRMMYELRNNGPLSTHFAHAMHAAGREVLVAIDDFEGAGASTDFGNVTYAVPAAHPHFSIPATEGKSNHTPEFRDRCRSAEAHALTWEFAAGMAATAGRFLADDAFAKDAKRAWEEDMARVGKPE